MVKAVEPRGILLAVIGLGFTLWARQVERADRKEDRINRAIGQFADGVGRIDALRLPQRNGVDLRALKAEGAYLPAVDLGEVDLRDGKLVGAYPSGANLYRANLSRANLAMTYMAEAELDEAQLDWARLTGADLVSAQGPTSTEQAFVVRVSQSSSTTQACEELV